jgi:hypothetical protein
MKNEKNNKQNYTQCNSMKDENKATKVKNNKNAEQKMQNNAGFKNTETNYKTNAQTNPNTNSRTSMDNTDY